MGLTKQYLAYKPVDSFNIIASGRPNVSFTAFNKVIGRYLVVGAAENAIIWDFRLGEKVAELKREKHEVTAIRSCPDQQHIAVGYADGAVEVFLAKDQSSVCTLALHKTAVSILRYDERGIRLISGGLDNEVVVSDMVSQSGKHRLTGHNAPVTDVHFLERLGLVQVVVSSSKDTQIKFWNLETQSCFKTIVDNRTEVWALAIVGGYIVAGSGGSTMNVYRISKKDSNDESKNSIAPLIADLSLDDEDTISPIDVTNCGAVQRAGKGRTVSLIADESGKVLSCHGTNDLVENFYVCSKEEAASRLAKRLKKNPNTASFNEMSLADEIKRLPSVKCNTKIKSIDVITGEQGELRLAVNSANNSLRLYSLDLKAKKSEAKLLRSITQSGHQSEVRAVCFSSDSLAIASGSGESLKLWSQQSLQCLRTIETNYILTLCFVPGDRHVLCGMKTGHLLIVDIGTGDVIEEIVAHSKELWSICLLPDLKGCVTGSSDTTAKIWSFELVDNSSNDGSSGQKSLSLLHRNTIKLEETVLCIRVDPNCKFLAVGLLDSTVKIFFLDSFKFYLSLYGHKLPVLCMDISYDSKLIATGSADRNVKIWGLDFGDCHKSLFAHDDSVMGLQFIPKTHMFFTCGKDGKIKQWDADSFNKIVTLPGHVGEAYSLAVSPNGRYVVSCGSDRTLRLFERTDEPLILQDVQEEEREEIENRSLATGEDNTLATLPGLKLASRKTVGAEQCAETILECLDVCSSFDEDDDKNKELHPLMLAHDATNSMDFLVAVLQRIRASDLEESLVILPFSYVCQLLERLSQIATYRRDQTELICKVVLFLFRIHQKQITSNEILLPAIGNIIRNLQTLVVELRDVIGVNYHGLQMLQSVVEERENVELFRDATRSKKQKERKQRRRQLTKRLHIQMS